LDKNAPGASRPLSAPPEELTARQIKRMKRFDNPGATPS
jgi:hypothetical protein